MNTAIPVLEDMNGYFNISMYESNNDGTFRRTPNRPFRLLSGVIKGVTSPVGKIECNPRSRLAISWRSPTVINYTERKPQSAYRYFREKLSAKHFYIATAQDGMIRTRTLFLHEVEFKSGTSPAVKRIFSDKFIDSMALWGVSKKLIR